jgi:hypothetical protein
MQGHRRQHQLELLGVDLHQAHVGGDACSNTIGGSTSARVVVWGPKPVASASRVRAMIEADSTG